MNSIEWLTRLVAFDTVSRHSNLPLLACVQAWFAEHQVQSRLIPDPVTPKANLFATLPADDGSSSGGIILSGHTDVVPVDGQVWETDPFVATQREGKIFGRGTCDMKGFIAVTLALLPEFIQMRRKHPIHFAYSYDEEVGCCGAKIMVADLKQHGIAAQACIVGEPTNMRPVVGHKGIQAYRCRVHGLAAHSSLTPQGCNAIEYAAELICYIRKLADAIKQSGPFDQHYDVPFTSISTNMISGGTANNIIPAMCEFFFEFRNLASVNPDDIISKIKSFAEETLLPKMQKEHPSAAIDIDKIAVVPCFESTDLASINQLARAITGTRDVLKVAYATEAGLFQQANIPTIVCGPGSIEQAHRPNEFVLVEQLEKCEEFLRKVVL